MNIRLTHHRGMQPVRALRIVAFAIAATCAWTTSALATPAGTDAPPAAQNDATQNAPSAAHNDTAHNDADHKDDGTAWTLSRIVRQAVATYPAVQAAEAGIDIAAASQKLAGSSYLPRINLIGIYQRKDPVPSISIPGFPGEFSLGPHNFYDAHISIQQQIYDFGRTHARKEQAKTGHHTAEIRVDAIREAVALQAVQAFYTTLLFDRSIRVEQDEIDRFQEARRVAKQRRENGAGTDFEVRQTETRISSAQSKLVSLKSQRHKAKIALKSLIGRAGGPPIHIMGALQKSTDVPDLATLLDRAETLRPELNIKKQKIQKAAAVVKTQQADNYPTLGASLEAGVRDGYPLDVEKAHLNSSITAQINIPLYNGTARRHVKLARAKLQAAKADLETTRTHIQVEIRQAYEDLNASIAQLQSAQAQTTQAQEAGNLARVRYKAGTITNLDLLDAETRIAQAQLQKAQVLYDINLRRYALEHAVGDLLESLDISP